MSIVIGSSSMTLQNDMFAKDFFKQNVRLIEIELFSFCNRTCWFCPNSEIDRLSHNVVLEESTYLDIISQLAKVNYDGEITYSRYNEPLSNKDIILSRIKAARDMLPLAKLRTNTNGDYLDREYIFQLRDAGLNELFVQQYLSNNELYDHKKISSKLFKKAVDLGFTYSIVSDIPGQRIEVNLNTVGITTHIRARNFSKEGSGRTKFLSSIVSSSYVRTKSCSQPFNNMYVDYNGNVMVCCNTRSDINSHAGGIMGNVSKNKLWEIFISDAYAPWRNMLGQDGIKTGICATCKIGLSTNEF